MYCIYYMSWKVLLILEINLILINMDISETNLNSNENMFNKKSKLNELLEKDNKCKLEEVLDQEELITELKYQKNYLFN